MQHKSSEKSKCQWVWVWLAVGQSSGSPSLLVLYLLGANFEGEFVHRMTFALSGYICT